jgi:hypothetical protein
MRIAQTASTRTVPVNLHICPRCRDGVKKHHAGMSSGEWHGKHLWHKGCWREEERELARRPKLAPPPKPPAPPPAPVLAELLQERLAQVQASHELLMDAYTALEQRTELLEQFVNGSLQHLARYLQRPAPVYVPRVRVRVPETPAPLVVRRAMAFYPRSPRGGSALTMPAAILSVLDGHTVEGLNTLTIIERVRRLGVKGTDRSIATALCVLNKEGRIKRVRFGVYAGRLSERG